jgi:hypothetical protein
MPPLSLTGTTFSASFSSSSSFSLLKCKGLHHRRRLSSPHCVVFFGVPRTSRIRRRKHTNTNWKNKAATLRSSKNDSFFFNDDENENENETNENTNEENVEDDDFEAKVVAENETFFFEEASSSSVPSPADFNLLQKANTSSSSSSVWKTKPFWCQPWTIVLFGVFCVSLPTLVFDWKFVSVAVAVPISAWWYVFLVLYPKSYASSSFEEKEEDFGR